MSTETIDPIADINDKLAKLGDLGANVDKALAEFGERLPVKAEPPAAEMEQGPLAGIAKMEVWGIPLGKALIGGGIAIFATELIDGFMAAQAPQMRGIVKLVGAGASQMLGKRWIGAPTASAIALLLAFDGIRDLLPMDEFIHGITTRMTGVFTTAGLAGVTKRGNGGGAKATTDYYSKSLGGGF